MMRQKLAFAERKVADLMRRDRRSRSQDSPRSTHSNDGDKLTTAVKERKIAEEIELIRSKKEEKQDKTNLTLLSQKEIDKRGGIIRGFDDAPSISEFSDTPENSYLIQEAKASITNSIRMSDIMATEKTSQEGLDDKEDDESAEVEA